MNDPGSPLLVTMDVDWVPDWMIQDVLDRLVRRGVKATFFATHQSPVLQELSVDPRFEVGIHPNFLPGSTHGATPAEVLATLKDWYPGARACRTHSLVQSEPLLALMARHYGIAIDASIHLPRARDIAPHALVLEDGGPRLVRVPHMFQDNMHAMSGRPWTPEGTGLNTPGWKVLNFHPVHVVSNMSRIADYQKLKERGAVGTLRPDDLPSYDPAKPGAGTFFDHVLERAKEAGAATLSQAVAAWEGAASP